MAAWLAATGRKVAPPQRPVTGTITAGVVLFMGSAAYQNLAPSTRAYIRRGLEAIRATWGHARFADLQARHIRADLAKLPPHPANNRLRAWRALCRWAFAEAALIDSDPATAIPRRVTPDSDGHLPWTADDVSRFRAYWDHATPQRLAFEVFWRTGAAVVDAVRLGPAQIRDGWLTYTRQKSGSVAVCPMSAATAPAWYGHDDHLAECQRRQPRHLTWLVTAQGAPRSEKAASQWFAAACRKAGIEGKAAHGIRKLRAAMWLEAGASAEQRMAILGHETASEARRYSRSADLRRTVQGTQISNSVPELPTSAVT